MGCDYRLILQMHVKVMVREQELILDSLEKVPCKNFNYKMCGHCLVLGPDSGVKLETRVAAQAQKT